MRTSDDDEVRSTVLRHFADSDTARDAIDRYFYREGFTGARFEQLTASDEPDYFTANDIVAVSTLSVTVPPPVSVWL